MCALNYPTIRQRWHSALNDSWRVLARGEVRRSCGVTPAGSAESQSNVNIAPGFARRTKRKRKHTAHTESEPTVDADRETDPPLAPLCWAERLKRVQDRHRSVSQGRCQVAFHCSNQPSFATWQTGSISPLKSLSSVCYLRFRLARKRRRRQDRLYPCSARPSLLHRW